MKKIILLLTLIAVFIGCGKKEVAENNVLRVGATPVPHSELLNLIKNDLKKEGIDLQIIEFTDYVTPNLALNDGEIDANFFQHVPYLESFSKDRNLKLVVAGKVHVEPLGLYSKKYTNLKDLPDGALIIIPNDPSNGARALILLEYAGLIKLDPKAGLKATEFDIVTNTHNFKFKAIDAAQIPRTLEDVDAAVINGNYALQSDLNPIEDSILLEGANSPYANIVVVKENHEKNKKIVALINALQSEKVKKFILENYKGGVVPAF
ncbi:MetQ/NlpA family ABC transporter substrate-binding protein [Psychrilyobacter sp.]|uniref:MetQ/NlpA family ABC transporter substrate-binding protein n=1 Tax=Psychrilyobacter sp. TaxID=2586924 RepID=UPI00301B52C2